MTESNIIVFNVSKKEQGIPNQNMKKIIKKYKGPYKCTSNKEEINFEKLKHAGLVIFTGPRQRFNPDEIKALTQYIQNGGNVLVMASEGGDERNNTNLNELLTQFGIEVISDCVVRTSFYKYFHPKEAYVHNGILNEEISRVANGLQRENKKPQNSFLANVIGKDDDDEYLKEQSRGGLDFVYANGCTLKLESKALPILGSGALSYPSNRPVGAIYTTKNGKGKLIVTGSYEMFTDEYFDKEDNSKIFDFFIKYFMTKEVQFEKSAEDTTNYKKDYAFVPDISEISDKLKSCLQESDDLPYDYKELFNADLFSFDTDLIPDAIKLYTQMNVKHEPLTLIVPQFETPMLGLQPAIFPPILRELPPPNLEQFDLDEEFASEKVRLAQLTNKCENKDIDYFVKQSGDILGVTEKIQNKHNPKAILSYVLQELVNFKKYNQG